MALGLGKGLFRIERPTPETLTVRSIASKAVIVFLASVSMKKDPVDRFWVALANAVVFASQFLVVKDELVASCAEAVGIKCDSRNWALCSLDGLGIALYLLRNCRHDTADWP